MSGLFGRALAGLGQGASQLASKYIDEDLAKRSFRAGLRVKRVAGTAAIFEMTWAPDGRATFEYGASDEKER